MARRNGRAWSCVVFLIAAVAAVSSQRARPAVKVDAGTLLGKWTPEFPNVAEFTGIPYAKPPVGALRWRSPEPPSPWARSYFDATKPPTQCTQLPTILPRVAEYTSPKHSAVKGEEDCLYLNVYAHRSALDAAPAPPGAGASVIVFIHGGAYDSGGMPRGLKELAAFSSGRAIFVTVHYRLGVLGFLWSDELAAREPGAGNFGLLDQRMALRWVQANAAAFGGDPGRVTAWGQSAGAGSIASHMCMPGSAGLFHRAVLQSCSFACVAATTTGRARASYAAVLQRARCTSLGCLRNISASWLVVAGAASMNEPSALIGCCSMPMGLFIPWSPVVGATAHPELPLHPYECVARGTVARMPLLHGFNRDEGFLFSIAPFKMDEGSLREEWTRVFGQDLAGGLARVYTEGGQEASEHMARRLLPLNGLNNGLKSLSGQDSYSRFFIAEQRSLGDATMSCATRRVSQVLADAGEQPTFAYSFEHVPALTKVARLPFVMHAAELPFLFMWHTSLTVDERKLSTLMVQYWLNFAETGDPNRGPYASGAARSAARMPLPTWPTYSAQQAGVFMRFMVGAPGARVPACSKGGPKSDSDCKRALRNRRLGTHAADGFMRSRCDQYFTPWMDAQMSGLLHPNRSSVPPFRLAPSEITLRRPARAAASIPLEAEAQGSIIPVGCMASITP